MKIDLVLNKNKPKLGGGDYGANLYFFDHL